MFDDLTSAYSRPHDEPEAVYVFLSSVSDDLGFQINVLKTTTQIRTLQGELIGGFNRRQLHWYAIHKYVDRHAIDIDPRAAGFTLTRRSGGSVYWRASGTCVAPMQALINAIQGEHPHPINGD